MPAHVGIQIFLARLEFDRKGSQGHSMPGKSPDNDESKGIRGARSERCRLTTARTSLRKNTDSNLFELAGVVLVAVVNYGIRKSSIGRVSKGPAWGVWVHSYAERRYS